MTSSSASVASSIKACLTRLADSHVAAGKAAYFKHICSFHGIKTADIEGVYKSSQVQLSALSAKDLLGVSCLLLADEFHESKQLGAFILYKDKPRLISTASNDLFAAVEKSFDDGHVFDWATADSLSTRVLGQLLLKDPVVWSAKLQDWSKQEDKPWKMRTAAVAFIPACKHIGKASSWPHASSCRDSLLLIAKNVLQKTAAFPTVTEKRFPHLGVGWSLRELGASSAANHAAVIAFVRENLSLFTREGLAYALEKSSASLQTEMLVALKAGNKPVAVASSSSAKVGTKRKRE